jgi:SAM-dependent methyltransferase
MQLNHLNRYAPVLDLIVSSTPSHVLDVGCGSLGIGEFTDAPFVGCDVTFVNAPPVTMTPVRGSAASLPFGNETFDLVVSLDMLEHLPTQSRANAIHELLRVSRCQVIIGCPCGNLPWTSDYLLSKCFGVLRQHTPSWLSEHMAAPFPTRRSIERVLAENDRRYAMIYNESIVIHQMVIIADIVFLGRLLGSVTRRIGAFGGGWLPSVLSRLSLQLRFGPPYRWVFVVEKANMNGTPA